VNNEYGTKGCAILCTIHQPSSEIFSIFHKAIVLRMGEVMFDGKISELEPYLEYRGYAVPPHTNLADLVILVAQTDGSFKPERNRQDQISPAFEKEGSPIVVSKPMAETPGFWVQSQQLALRELRNVYRDKGFLIANVVITLVLNLVFGAVFYQAANRTEAEFTVSSAFGSLLIVLTTAMFSSAQGPLLAFPLERAIMIREYQTGTVSNTLLHKAVALSTH